ncbi:hypothetical protein E3N88_01374 [Mikania micrantha]|uniref:Uncharacterized protein n=1 Tax=Mikania micrantha TaxID=192012 RepID=A0A5N6Q331_9ASTR|nr:hypothetical protein E3N88_01374 [Mikania micrantha]
MCPMRVVLVFFSAILAGYITWKSLRASVETDDMATGDEFSANKQESSIIKLWRIHDYLNFIRLSVIPSPWSGRRRRLQQGRRTNWQNTKQHCSRLRIDDEAVIGEMEIVGDKDSTPLSLLQSLSLQTSTNRVIINRLLSEFQRLRCSLVQTSGL